MIAALFVMLEGCYFNLPGVDPWDESRDARRYLGPHPVVAHPPCAPWGRLWHFTHNCEKGKDGGCFASALSAVRTWGGVIEHPAGSSAWKRYSLKWPPRKGGWVPADDEGGWTCCVEQGHYGHRGRKATWLYAKSAFLPALKWGPSNARMLVKNMGPRERAATPIPFRDLLLSIARA